MVHKVSPSRRSNAPDGARALGVLKRELLGRRQPEARWGCKPAQKTPSKCHVPVGGGAAKRRAGNGLRHLRRLAGSQKRHSPLAAFDAWTGRPGPGPNTPWSVFDYA